MKARLTKPESGGLPEPQENAGFLPPQLWVPQSGPLTEAIASRWCQEPWRPVAEEREQRQTTRMLGELNKLHPSLAKRYCLKSASPEVAKTPMRRARAAGGLPEHGPGRRPRPSPASSRCL